MKVLFAVIFGLVIAAPVVGKTQIGYLWSFDELRSKADAVVIAEHVRTIETPRRADHPELKPSLPVIELESTLKVLAVLSTTGKEGPMRELHLKHYRVDFDEWGRRNPPQPGLPPPGLLNAGSVLDFRDGSGPYLLFLERGEGGVYEPLSGHAFPTESVFLLRKQGR